MKLGHEPQVMSSKKEKGKPLIEEIDPSPSPSISTDESKIEKGKVERAKPKTGTKKKKAVKAGFLNAKDKRKGLGLYSEEGSCEGGKEGSYSRLMSRSKIVDMSQMTPEQQQAAMKSHAGVPGSGAHSSAAPSNMGAQKEMTPENETDFGDMEFEELMKKADPDYAQTAPKEDHETMNQL